MAGRSTSTGTLLFMVFRDFGTGTVLLFSLLEDGDAEGGSDDFSTIKESWMIMDGTLSATNNGGEEEYKTESAAVVMAASGFSTLATGSSDTADKIKPFVEREKCLITAETWLSIND
jgi:hypothetical protein